MADLELQSVLRIGKNAVARLSAQVGVRLLSVLLVALVARYEGAAGLGRYALVLTVLGFATAAADLGLNTLLTRDAARTTATGRQRELIGDVLPLKVTLSIAVHIALVALSPVAPLAQAARSLLPLSGLLLLPEALTGAMVALINARQRMEVSGIVSLAARLVTVALAWPALYLGYGIPAVLVCNVAATWLGVALLCIVLRRWGLWPRWRWQSGPWCGYLREAYPFALTGVIATVYMRADLLLLGLWQGEAAAGVYSAAYKLWETVGLLPASVLDALFPEMSRLSASAEGMQRLRRLFHDAGRMMLGGALLLSIASAVGARACLVLLYGSAGGYEQAVPVLRVLVWAVPAMFLYLLGGHTLYALGRQRQVTLVMLVVGIANIAANLWVIPRWSYLGAGVVALLSEWLLCSLLYPLAWRAIKRPLPERDRVST